MSPWRFGFWPHRDEGGTYEREGEAVPTGKSLPRSVSSREGGLKPIVRTYMYTGEDRSCCRYVLVLMLVAGSVLPLLGPALGIFVIDPLIQLTLTTASVVTPKTDCFDTKVDSQICKGDIHTDFYFFNITNTDRWMAGQEPPSYQEVGPYAFMAREKRYGVTFTNDWNEVAYTFHQWNEFVPELSCETCMLGDTVIGVNRAYLQFISASKAAAAGKLTPEPTEEAMAMALLPITMAVVFGTMVTTMRAGIEAQYAGMGAPLPTEAALQAAAQGAAVQQWTDCAPLLGLDPTKPYLQDLAPQIPYPTELCAFIPVVALQQFGMAITPAQFAAVGAATNTSINLPYASTGAFLAAAIGASNATYLDPAAGQFLGAFLTLPRAGLLGALGSSDPALATALAPLTDAQWGLLQGYLLSLGPTWSHAVYMGWKSVAPPPAPEVPDPEGAVIYSLMPTVLYTITSSILAAVAPAVQAQYAQYGITDPATVGAAAQQAAYQQWTNCAPLLMLDPSKPYLRQLAPQFPFDPELCAYIPTVSQQLFGLTVAPSQLADMGADLPLAAATAFLQAAIGQTNATFLDPQAQQFVTGFLTANRTAMLGLLGVMAPPLATALSPLTELHWNLLKGYVASLVPTWGTLVFGAWLGGGGGGLVVTKTVDQWLFGYEDPVLLAAAQMLNPQYYRLTPYMYTASLAFAFPNETYVTDYLTAATGVNFTVDMLSYKSTDFGRFHPLVQQKKMTTGKARSSKPQKVMLYRGVPYLNKTHGIVNMTGLNEGIQFGSSVDSAEEPILFESSLSRPIQTKFMGNKLLVKGVEAYQFGMHEASLGGCNMTEYGLWALSTAFDPDDYHDVIDALPPGRYWDLMGNDTELSAYLAATPLRNLGRYFGTPDVARDRCMAPDMLAGVWDVSATFGCPSVITFPHYLGTAEFVKNTTGNGSVWQPDDTAHGWYFALEPVTGFAIQGHKPAQMSFLVSRTTHVYPYLWVAPGSGAAVGLTEDFVTVPGYWWKTWWEPTDDAAKLIGSLIKANDALYYLLVSSLPALGWLLQFPAVIMLFFTSKARRRKAELKKLQKSQARRLKLSKREVEMVDALVRAARGSRVLIPADVDDLAPDSSDDEGAVPESTAENGQGGKGKEKEKMMGYMRKLTAKVAPAAATATAERKPPAGGKEEIEAYVPPPPSRGGGDGGDGDGGSARGLLPEGSAPSHSQAWHGAGGEAAGQAGGGGVDSKGGGLRRRTTSTSG